VRSPRAAPPSPFRSRLGAVQPLVSILIPCFRSRAFLPRALESALAQTYRHLEVVVVDNASDDGTDELVAGYARADARVRYQRNDENVGPVRNWRKAARLGRGELAALLFSDDWYEPGFIDRAVQALGDPSIGWVHAAVLLERPGAPPQVDYALPGPERHATAEFLRSVYEGRGPRMPWSPGCAVLRRPDLVRWLDRDLPGEARYAFLSHGAGPDVLVYLQACLEYPAFVHLAEPQAHFLWHEENLSRRPIVRQAYLEALDAFLAASPGAPVDRRRARAVSWLRSRRFGRPHPGLGPGCWPHLAAFVAGRALASLRGRP